MTQSDQLPGPMAGVVLTGYGGFERLEYRTDLPVPDPAPGEVLVHVSAAGMNNTDINTRTGWYNQGVTTGTTSSGFNVADDGMGAWAADLDFPRIQGADVSGMIVATGAGVDAARIGRRVVCDPYCRAETDRAGIELVQFLGSERDGGFAQFCVVPDVKIGRGEPADDVDRITTIMQAMGPGERCWFDVNRAWTVDQAMQVVPRVAHLTPLIEQPCETYEECRIVSQRTGLGLMLDESIDGADAFIQARRDGVMDVAALKFNATGGIGRHRFLAQLGVELGVPMRIDDLDVIGPPVFDESTE